MGSHIGTSRRLCNFDLPCERPTSETPAPAPTPERRTPEKMPGEPLGKYGKTREIYREHGQYMEIIRKKVKYGKPGEKNLNIS